MYRYVSDGEMAVAINKDARARVLRPMALAGLAFFTFMIGFGLYVFSYRGFLPHHLGEVLRNASLSGLTLTLFPVVTLSAAIPLALTGNSRRMRRLFPYGSVTEVAVGEDALVVKRPSGARSISYAEIRMVQDAKHIQWVMTRGRRRVEVLPAHLLPPDVIEQIRARSAGMSPVPEVSTPPISTRNWIVPPGWAAHAAAAHTLMALRRPDRRFWLRLARMLAVFTCVALVAGSGWLLAVPTLLVLGLVLSYVRTRRMIAAALPGGSEASTEFHEDRFVSRNALGAREIPFDHVRGVQVRGDVVFLQLANLAGRLIVARELIPDDELERLACESLRRG